MTDDLYRWRGDEHQRLMYPYVKDELDIAAFNLYAKRGFLPPTRPDGFLDDMERGAWDRWRAKAKGQS